MILLQLKPEIPVIVESKKNAPGRAIGWLDYSEEDHLYWIVALDDGGEVWIVPNSDIRLQKNYSLGRKADATRTSSDE